MPTLCSFTILQLQKYCLTKISSAVRIGAKHIVFFVQLAAVSFLRGCRYFFVFCTSCGRGIYNVTKSAKKPCDACFTASSNFGQGRKNMLRRMRIS